MSAVVSDVLETRLDLAGLSTYVQGIGTVTGALGILEGKLDDVSTKRLSFAIAGGATALGIFALLGDAANEAGNEAADYAVAVRNLKGSFPLGEMQEFADELGRATGVDDGDIASLLGILGSFQISGGDAKTLAEPILNAQVALRALGLDAKQISNQVGKALQTGDASGLKRSGVVLDEVKFKSASAAGRVKILQDALNAQGGSDAARKFKQEWPGAIQALVNSLNNFKGNVGDGLTTPLLGAIGLATDFVDRVNGMDPKVFQAIGLGAAGIATGLGVAAFATGVLAAQNVILSNRQLKAAEAAAKQKKDEDGAATAMGGAGTASTGLVGKLAEVVKAHWAAATAANAQADAEERLSGTSTGGGRTGGARGKPGSVSLPDLGGGKAKKATPSFDPDATIHPGSAASKGFKLPKVGAGAAAEVAEDAAKLGMGAKLGRGALKLGKGALKGGAAGIVASLATDLALNMLPDEGGVGVGKRVTKGAVEGAGWGALVGSIIPGLGTGVGAVAGGAIGAGAAGFGEWQKGEEAKKAADAAKVAATPTVASDPAVEHLKAIAETLRKIEKKESPIGYGQVSQFEQARALARLVKV